MKVQELNNLSRSMNVRSYSQKLRDLPLFSLVMEFDDHHTLTSVLFFFYFLCPDTSLSVQQLASRSVIFLCIAQMCALLSGEKLFKVCEGKW